MPILYVHGVATRDPRHPFEEIETYLRRYVAPALSSQVEEVDIIHAYWGELGARFAYGGISRPRSVLLGQGVQNKPSSDLERALLSHALAFALPPVLPTAPAPCGGVSGGLTSGKSSSAVTASTLRLRDLPVDALSDLLVEMVAATEADAGRRAAWVLAADTVAQDPTIGQALARAPDAQAELEVVLAALRQQASRGTLAPMGALDALQRLGDGLSEALGRAASAPGAIASVVAGELRKGVNDFVSTFIGDVFVYLKNRFAQDGVGPGPIQQVFLDRLERALTAQRDCGGQPIVLLSHSMGGQIVYDALTHFVPRDERFKDLRVKLWCATASQVGFFEELRLFAADAAHDANGQPKPFPSQHLDTWWNVWDPNDFISFTTRGIIQGVDDGPYVSGMTLLGAHSGYLQRPTFYRMLRARLERAMTTSGSA